MAVVHIERKGVALTLPHNQSKRGFADLGRVMKRDISLGKKGGVRSGKLPRHVAARVAASRVFAGESITRFMHMVGDIYGHIPVRAPGSLWQLEPFLFPCPEPL